jgi:CelD/BcsL family acetyltransferase involved in cellulose biosynthesis
MNNALALPRSSTVDGKSSPVIDQQASHRQASVTAMRTAPAAKPQSPVHVEVFTSFEAAASIWASLEQGGHGSVYQTQAWCRTWFEHCADAATHQPLIISISLGGEPALLLPLYACPDGMGLSVARFMGDDHCNARVALTSSDPKAQSDLLELGQNGDLMKSIEAAIAAQTNVAHMFLDAMPEAFNGVLNPLAISGWTRSPAVTFVGKLQCDFDALCSERLKTSARSQLRRKQKKLVGHGDVSFQWEHSPDIISAALDTFFEQKSARQHMHKATSNFDSETNRNFVRALAKSPSGVDAKPLLELFTLRHNGDVIALLGGARHNKAYSLALLSITSQEQLDRYSPGVLALQQLVKELCADGLTLFDFGLGELRYKRTWGDRQELRTVSRAIRPLGKLSYARLRASEVIRSFILADEKRAQKARALRYTLHKLRGKT